jgi:hypothetical protein
MSKLSRRSVVATAATLPALAVPALAASRAVAVAAPTISPAAESDPIFAAINAHSRALTKLDAACDGPEDFDEAADACNEAERNIVRTVPTTAAGIAALLRFVQEQTDRDAEYFSFFMETGKDDLMGYHALYASLRRAAEALAARESVQS